MKPSDQLILPEYYTGADAETTGEIAEKKGMSIESARRAVKKMVEAGLWSEVLVKRPGKRNAEKAYIVKEN